MSCTRVINGNELKMLPHTYIKDWKIFWILKLDSKLHWLLMRSYAVQNFFFSCHKITQKMWWRWRVLWTMPVTSSSACTTRTSCGGSSWEGMFNCICRWTCGPPISRTGTSTCVKYPDIVSHISQGASRKIPHWADFNEPVAKKSKSKLMQLAAELIHLSLCIYLKVQKLNCQGSVDWEVHVCVFLPPLIWNK